MYSRLQFFIFLLYCVFVFTGNLINSSLTLQSSKFQNESVALRASNGPSVANTSSTELSGRKTNLHRDGLEAALNKSKLHSTKFNASRGEKQLLSRHPRNVDYGLNQTIQTSFKDKTEMWSYISNLMSYLVHTRSSQRGNFTDDKSPRELPRYYYADQPVSTYPLPIEEVEGMEAVTVTEEPKPLEPTSTTTSEIGFNLSDESATDMLDLRAIPDEQLLSISPVFRNSNFFLNDSALHKMIFLSSDEDGFTETIGNDSSIELITEMDLVMLFKMLKITFLQTLSNGTLETSVPNVFGSKGPVNNSSGRGLGDLSVFLYELKELLGFIQSPHNISQSTSGRKSQARLLHLLESLEINLLTDFPKVEHEASEVHTKDVSRATEFSNQELNGRVIELATKLSREVEILQSSLNYTHFETNATAEYIKKYNSAKARMSHWNMLHENYNGDLQMHQGKMSEDDHISYFEEVHDVHKISYWFVNSNYKVNQSKFSPATFPNSSNETYENLSTANETVQLHLNATARFNPFVDEFFGSDHSISELLKEVSAKVANETVKFEQAIQTFINNNQGSLVIHTKGENITYQLSDKNDSKAKTSFDALTELELRLEKEEEEIINETVIGRTSEISHMNMNTLLDGFHKWMSNALSVHCLTNYTEQQCEILLQAVQSNLKFLNRTIADIIHSSALDNNATNMNRTEIIFNAISRCFGGDGGNFTLMQNRAMEEMENSTNMNVTEIIKATARFFDGEHANLTFMHDKAMEEMETVQASHSSELELHPQHVLDEMEKPMQNDSKYFRQLAESYSGRNNTNDTYFQKGSHESRSTNISLEKIQLIRPVKTEPSINLEKQTRQSKFSNATLTRPSNDSNATLTRPSNDYNGTLTRPSSNSNGTLTRQSSDFNETLIDIRNPPSNFDNNEDDDDVEWAINTTASARLTTLNETTATSMSSTKAKTEPTTYIVKNETTITLSTPKPTYSYGTSPYLEINTTANIMYNSTTVLYNSTTVLYTNGTTLTELVNYTTSTPSYDATLYQYKVTKKPYKYESGGYGYQSNPFIPIFGSHSNQKLNLDDYQQDKFIQEPDNYGNPPMSDARLTYEIMCFGKKDCAKELNEICIQGNFMGYCDCPLHTIRNQITKVCENLNYGYLSRHKRNSNDNGETEIVHMGNCSSKDCFSRGQCRFSSSNASICICDSWYYGKHCQIDLMIALISLMIGVSFVTAAISLLSIFYFKRRPKGWTPLALDS